MKFYGCLYEFKCSDMKMGAVALNTSFTLGFLSDLDAFQRFKYERLRLDRELLNLRFLNICKNMNTTPNVLKMNNWFMNHNCTQTVKQFQQRCLRSYIRQKYALINSLTIKTKDAYNKYNRGNTALSRLTQIEGINLFTPRPLTLVISDQDVRCVRPLISIISQPGI